MRGLTLLCFTLMVTGLTVAHPHHNYLLTTAVPSDVTNSTRLGIYNGTPTTIQSHPYMVSILYNGWLLCSGTIVSTSWVVTAGDCVYGVPLSRLMVVAGSSNAYSGTYYLVQQSVLHPNYGQSLMSYDYACLQVLGSFQFSSVVRPIPLAKTRPVDNTQLVVAGWGLTHIAGKSESNNLMMQTVMTWLPLSTCASYYSGFPITWYDTTACAKDFQRSSTLCAGDWGDAFVLNGVFYGMFVGCATSGFCTSQARPSIIATIPAASSWIAGVTGAQFETA